MPSNAHEAGLWCLFTFNLSAALSIAFAPGATMPATALLYVLALGLTGWSALGAMALVNLAHAR